MPTWDNWATQFLNRAGILSTPPNQTFMADWAKHATSSCVNNPIDLSVSESGARKCANNTGIHPTTYRYTSHGQAASAFNTEIHQPWAHAIFAALDSGNPYQYAGRQDVASALVSWGSPNAGNTYLGGTGSGGGAGGGNAPSTHKAWGDLRKSLNANLPNAVRASRKSRAAALRALQRARKVRL